MPQAEIEWNSARKDYGVVNFTSDRDLMVIFYWKSDEDRRQSVDGGVPIYKDYEYVKIFRPGEMMNVIDRPVREDDKRKYSSQYQQFQMKKSQVPEGTPLDVLFINNPSVADTLRGYGVYTVQQLSNLTAHAIDTIGMGGQDYVNRANAYLKAASSGKEVVKMQDEMRKMSNEIDTRNKQIHALQAQVNNLIEKMTSKDEGRKDNTDLGHVSGVDIQAERIKANHITSELMKAHTVPKK